MARILIVGAGGVGGAFGAELASAGHDVAFVARGRNLEALRNEGLHVAGARGELHLDEVTAVADPREASPRDLIILCMKTYDLAEAVASLKLCSGLVLTLQNGVDAAQEARAVLGDRVLAGTTGIVADLAEPGHVTVVSSYARIRFGEPDGGMSERVRQTASWLDRAAIEVEALEDVRVALWEKMALICAMAGLTTLYEQPVGPILADPYGLRTFRRIVRECEAVARARGVVLPDTFAADREAYVRTVDPAATSSMLRDLLRGRRLEIDWLNGRVVTLGGELDIAVPVNEAVYAGVRLRSPV